MADKDFFKKDSEEEKVQEEEGSAQEETKEEEKETPEAIKVGDNEYSPDELSSLVELGKIGKEAEEKYNTKIDKVWPEFTKASQELKDFRSKAEAADKAKVDEKVSAGQELSEDEQKAQALDQGEKLGLVTNRTLRKEVLQVLEARDLLSDCRGFEKDMDGKDGRPAFKTQDVLAHMEETGIKNPEKAYKDKFESQLDTWKETQLSKAKPRGVVSETTSSAGGKEPSEVKATHQNLDSLIRESLYGK